MKTKKAPAALLLLLAVTLSGCGMAAPMVRAAYEMPLIPAEETASPARTPASGEASALFGGGAHPDGAPGLTMSFPERWTAAAGDRLGGALAPDMAFAGMFRAVAEDRLAAGVRFCFVARGPYGGTIALLTADPGGMSASDPVRLLDTLSYWLSVKIPGFAAGEAGMTDLGGNRYARMRASVPGDWHGAQECCFVRHGGRAWFYLLGADTEDELAALESVVASARFD